MIIIFVFLFLLSPKLANAVIMQTKCDWCGNKCSNSNIKMACNDLLPPVGEKCVEEFGACVIIKNLLPAVEPGFEWKMIWNDEFVSPTVDETKWRILGDEVRRDGWWLKKNVFIDNGNLVLKTDYDSVKNIYGSGAVDTFGKFENKYGYYEARIKFAKKSGHWGAFWLHAWGVSTVGNEGRDGTEIDIVEKPWPNDHIQQTLHWDGYGIDHKYAVNSIDWPGISDGFHTFGLDWQPDKYIFYIDGTKSWRTNAGGVSQIPEFIYLTDEVGKWIGDIDKNELPDNMYIDYVRVYSREAITPTPIITKPGDFNNDNIINLLDFGFWKTKYLQGQMTLLDFSIWKSAYLQS